MYASLIKKMEDLPMFMQLRNIQEQEKIIREIIPCDKECMRIAKQYTFDTSRKFAQIKHTINIEHVERGLELLINDSRFINKSIVAKIKEKNNEVKKYNYKLQKQCRAFLRNTHAELNYDYNRWDKIPRSVYSAGAKYSCDTMKNPIIQWVINDLKPV